MLWLLTEAAMNSELRGQGPPVQIEKACENKEIKEINSQRVQVSMLQQW